MDSLIDFSRVSRLGHCATEAFHCVETSSGLIQILDGQGGGNDEYLGRNLWLGLVALAELIVIGYATSWFGGSPQPAPQQ
ncbi:MULTISPECIES: hypothetical protein [Devosiaceae]|uniref:Uncharacterized protein n=2 Tax=Devosiaceae TaxID=2831106 RepID=A0A1G7ZVG6_9HYPH|nr:MULTISPECIES: hypothetical protein [Devosiaceae]MBO6728061.1 hypothetical protein [Rhizobiaceae bacterium]MVT01037.1 hypothetical protein [Devosia marina]SDH12681.1 hypothetical protein SAMN04487974_12317 [Pelagibacterium luteolum]